MLGTGARARARREAGRQAGRFGYTTHLRTPPPHWRTTVGAGGVDSLSVGLALATNCVAPPLRTCPRGNRKCALSHLALSHLALSH